jgi:hypothetical protein
VRQKARLQRENRDDPSHNAGLPESSGDIVIRIEACAGEELKISVEICNYRGDATWVQASLVIPLLCRIESEVQSRLLNGG